MFVGSIAIATGPLSAEAERQKKLASAVLYPIPFFNNLPVNALTPHTQKFPYHRYDKISNEIECLEFMNK